MIHVLKISIEFDDACKAASTLPAILACWAVNSTRFIQDLLTRFRNNTSEKEVYTPAVAYYNEVIRDILAALQIDHVRLNSAGKLS
jgi:hypothetical protein